MLNVRALNNRLNAQRNKVFVLNFIRTYPGITRAEVSKGLELSTSAVSDIVDDLIQQRLVEESDRSKSRRGRRPRALSVSRGNHFFLSIDIGAENLRVAVMDFSADILSLRRAKTAEFKSAENTIVAVRQLAQEAFKQAGLDCDRIEAIGCGISGCVEPKKGMVIYCPNIPHWNRFPLRSRLQETFRKPCYIEDSTPLKALAERYYGKERGVDNCLYLGFGVGIALGIFIHGSLYRGGCGGAGEIGHIPVVKNGKQCKCGNFGCLETVASGPIIIDQIRDALTMGVQSTLQQLFQQNDGRIGVENILVAVNSGDRLVCNTIRQAGEYLGNAMAAAVNMFNPDLVVLGGPWFRMGELIVKPIEEAIHTQTLPHIADNVRIELSELDDDQSTLIGGLALISESHWLPK